MKVIEKILAKLAESKSVKVRIRVAGCRLTPEKITVKLAGDPVCGVRVASAQNPKASVDAFRKLLADEIPLVREELAWNKNIPEFIRDELSDDKDREVRMAVCATEKKNIKRLIKLSNDPDPFVRTAVANNERTPIDILDKLENDPSVGVRETAARTKRIVTDM